MKSITLSLVGLIFTTNCFGQVERTVSSPVHIEGMENVESDIYEHFLDVLSGDVIKSDSVSITDNGYDKVIIFNAGDELRIYLMVEDANGYETAVQVGVDIDVDFSIYSEMELDTVIFSNPEALERSIRLQDLRLLFDEGASLSMLAIDQAKTQGRLNEKRSSLQESTISVDCAANGSAICCGFSDGKRVRIICVCSSNNGATWTTCFDSEWQ